MGRRNPCGSKLPSQDNIGNPARPAPRRKRNARSAGLIAATAAVSLFYLRPAVANPPIDVTVGIDTFNGTYTVTAGAVTPGNNAVTVENTGELLLGTASHLIVQDNGANDNSVITGTGLFEMDGGTALLGSALIVGNTDADNATANIFGGTLTISPTAGSDPSIYVGRLGTGSLLQNNSISASSVSATNLNIGTGSATALGTYELDAGTLSISSAINLGSVAGGTGNLLLTGGTISSSGAVLSLINGSLSLSGTASANLSSLTQTGGSYSQTAGSLTVGSANFSAASSFTFTGGSVTINGGTWTPFVQTVNQNNGNTSNHSSAWQISGASDPTVTLENGASASTAAGVIGVSGGVGTLNINNSTFTAAGTGMNVGEGGSNVDSAFIGASGTVTVSNGGKIITAGQGVAGFGGTGVLNILSGSSDTNSASIGVGVSGYNTTPTGFVSAQGTVNISGGSSLSTVTGNIGVSGGIGTVNLGTSGLTDTGSSWTNSGFIYVGGNSARQFGIGAINVYAGTSISTPDLTIYDGTATNFGTVNANGGTIDVTKAIAMGGAGSSFAQNLASFNLSNGASVNASAATLNMTSGTLGLADTSSMSVTSGTMSGGNLNLGGSATMTVGTGMSQSGGTVSVTGGTLSATTSFLQTAGTFNISGTGQVNAGTLFQGSPSISGGGLTANQVAISGGTFTGGSITANGGGVTLPTTSVSGVNNNNTYWIVGGAGAANATVNLSKGGDIDGNISSGIIGSAGGSGIVNITGSGGSGSHFSTLYLGFDGGNGTLNITGANNVSIDGGLFLGYGLPSTGTATMNVSGGSTVSSEINAVGALDGTGTLNLGVAGQTDSGTLFSTIFNFGVGGDPTITATRGNGFLNVYPGATLSVGGVLSAFIQHSTNTSGTINLAGGTIDAGLLSVFNPTGFNWTAGTLDLTNSGLSVGPTIPLPTADLSNIPSVNLSGGKILEMTGGTTISGGSLTIGNGTFQTGAITIGSGGTLEMGAGQTFTSGAITVNSGGTLGGGGTAPAAVVVNAGGKIAPGDPSTQTYSAGLNMSAGGTYDWQLASPPKDNNTGVAGTDYDTVKVTAGSLVLNGTSNFHVDLGLLSPGDQPDGSNNNAFWHSSHSWNALSVSSLSQISGQQNFDTVQNGKYFAGDFATQTSNGGLNVNLVYNELNITAGSGNNTSLGTLTLSGAAGKYLPVSMATGDVNSGSIDVAGLNPPNDSPLLVLMDVKGTTAAITQWADDLEGDQTGGIDGYTMQSVSNAAQFGTTIRAGDTGFLLTFNNINGSGDRFINFDWSAGNSGVLLDEVTVVPEPTALSLITLGSAALLLRRRRRPRTN